jgi:hypothetical protein
LHPKWTRSTRCRSSQTGQVSETHSGADPRLKYYQHAAANQQDQLQLSSLAIVEAFFFVPPYISYVVPLSAVAEKEIVRLNWQGYRSRSQLRQAEPLGMSPRLHRTLRSWHLVQTIRARVLESFMVITCSALRRGNVRLDMTIENDGHVRRLLQEKSWGNVHGSAPFRGKNDSRGIRTES